ncbi:MFS transporter [Galactobacter caseinivorans]|uniref:MFS transporter n=1 Tax=Galactobacter caseinivorans TaxID=2676123 RepID=A0A496PIS5_9MICC|nr:MFS transporter [Galactobacter caseinivorans]
MLDRRVSQTPSPQPRKFAALRDKLTRPYLFGAGLSMMADNIEHVITYWVLWQTFHSPLLTGFQVISHWLPFLLLSVPFGTLAERFDNRKLIQLAQVVFMLVSLAWGILFLTNTLELWHACVLLVLHGCAGALWAPAEQMMLHDYAEPEDLPGAVRLNATFRSLGMLAGPVVGSFLLWSLGPAWGILVNILFYLPMTYFMMRTPYTGHTRSGFVLNQRPTFGETLGVLRSVAHDRILLGMILLSGLVALGVGGSLQVSIPEFATTLGAGDEGGAGYGLLLFANGVGGVIGGLLLEATGAIKPTVRAAAIATILFGVTTVTVALTGSYVVAVASLVVGGVAALASASIGQAMVQLRAKTQERGRVVGVYNMFGSGLRTGNGVTLAVLGSLLGIGWAVAWGGIALIVGTVIIWLIMAGQQRRNAS